jgi:hypothetical protein
MVSAEADPLKGRNRRASHLFPTLDRVHISDLEAASFLVRAKNFPSGDHEPMFSTMAERRTSGGPLPSAVCHSTPLVATTALKAMRDPSGVQRGLLPDLAISVTAPRARSTTAIPVSMYAVPTSTATRPPSGESCSAPRPPSLDERARRVVPDRPR